MPHYTDGTPAQMFDRVNAPTGVRYVPDGKAEQIFSNAIVVGIDVKATSCELKVLVGSGEHLGVASGPDWSGIILSGYWTSANAKECQLLPRADAPAAVVVAAPAVATP